MRTLIKNAKLINEGKVFESDLLIEDDLIKSIESGISAEADQVIDAKGKYLMPGMIDDQVHFRDPGLTQKGDLITESKAAVAGGITSFMDMPNTIPNVLTQEILEDKFLHAAKHSLANFSFYMGVSNDNVEEVLKTDANTTCGVKIFMGASTGNMLVDNKETLERIFKECKLLICTHCEDEPTIQENFKKYKEKYGDEVPIEEHPYVRSEEACYKSSSYAVALAKKYGTRLHVLHLTTAKEMELFDNSKPLKEKRITAEVCVHHLTFSEEDYKDRGTRIKWNPSIKKASDREALWKALLDDTIDVIATDHAPHLSEEKARSNYFKCPAGGPLVQHALVQMLEHRHNGKISLEKIVQKVCHAPAITYEIEKRGFIREGYYADLVLLDLDNPWTVSPENVLYKCGWSPFDGDTFKSKVTHTFVNGNLVYENGSFNESLKGKRLTFERSVSRV